MNWEKLQTYGLSSEKTFEMLCNQLFENWCKEEYKSSLFSFSVVNGAGGDGGVESYAVLKDKSIIGLQAKWFKSSIEASQISQIRSSLKTAKKIRPEITKYIVCVPRDLASTTGRGINTESKRWDDFVSAMKTEFPELTVELWNDTKITTEIQKPFAAGIHKFWFTKSEIDYEKFNYVFDKAKNGWLSTKYVPDLSVPGQISHSLSRYIGDFDSRNNLAKKFGYIIDSCKQFEVTANHLIAACGKTFPNVKDYFLDAITKLHRIQTESKKIQRWLANEFTELFTFDENAFYISYGSIIEGIKTLNISFEYHFHISDIIKSLTKLLDLDQYSLLEETKASINKQCILFLGNPGTGKTHGVSAYAENLLKQQYHIPIIVQARSISESYSWKDIIVNTLGLSSTWNEDELWQALLSAANRNRFKNTYLQNEISVRPKILIIVDGIDESATYEKWVERIKETTPIVEKYPQIRFCFTSRPTAFASPIDFANVKHLNDTGDVPVFKLFNNYTKIYKINVQNCQWLKYALNTPLALKLFCELYAGKTISISEISEVSMNQLWRKKVEKIEDELNSKKGTSTRNQYIFKAIVALSRCFLEKGHIERTELLTAIKECVNITDEIAENILEILEMYGIVGSFCQKGTELSPNTYVYYTGIQGYFDYASAMQLITEYKQPSLIDFERCSKVNINTLYCLAIISIQQYKYLLTNNSTFKKVVNNYEFIELLFYSLQHADFVTAAQYKEHCLEFMQKSASTLVKIINKLILPLSRVKGHPLGISLLDEFLNEFDKPAQRDIIWSLPANLRWSEGKRWGKNEYVEISSKDNEEYWLSLEDLFDGLPIVYAWMLSNVNNSVRKACRDELMAWACITPKEFYKLFLHFADVNDPQIRSDLFSILMCLVYDGNDTLFIKDVSNWILSNVLAPASIDQNRDISVRYYSVAIIKKAKILGLFSDEEIRDYLPPYNVNNNVIDLNKNALAGTRMGGYSAIDYDLARYVLVDHINSDFNTWSNKQLDKFVKTIGKEKPDYKGITSEQFIISATYAFVLKMGWNEKDFYNFDKDESGDFIGGVDCSIGASYHSATHGAQSNVMTVCEKYVWQARNYISGFLGDRLLFGDNQIHLTDYNLLDDFLIPIQEIHQVDPDNISDDRPWYVPEPSVVIFDEDFESKELISNQIKDAPDIDWAKWIQVENSDFLYAVPHSKLMALNMYSCFYGKSGIETSLFINSIVIPTKDVSRFVKAIHNKELFGRVCNPTDWDGSVGASCYVTPKEVCWFPWKKHYDSYNTEELPDFTIHSAVDSCCYNFPEYGDVYYYMPSALLRTILGIIDTDGYLYVDKDNNVISEYSIAGEEWRTSQKYVLVGEDNIIQKLNENGLSLIWIMQELRVQTGYAIEQFGKFFTERRQYYIGYIKDGTFVSEKLITDFTRDLL